MKQEGHEWEKIPGTDYKTMEGCTYYLVKCRKCGIKIDTQLLGAPGCEGNPSSQVCLEYPAAPSCGPSGWGC